MTTCFYWCYKFCFFVEKVEGKFVRNGERPLFSCKRGPLQKYPTGIFLNSPPKMRLSGQGIPLSAESGQRLCLWKPRFFEKNRVKLFASRASLCKLSTLSTRTVENHSPLLYWAAASTNRCPHWGFPQKYKCGKAAYRFFSPKPHCQLLPETGFSAVKLSPFWVESQ